MHKIKPRYLQSERNKRILAIVFFRCFYLVFLYYTQFSTAMLRNIQLCRLDKRQNYIFFIFKPIFRVLSISKWTSAINLLYFEPIEHSRVCSRHFKNEEWRQIQKYQQRCGSYAEHCFIYRGFSARIDQMHF